MIKCETTIALRNGYISQFFDTHELSQSTEWLRISGLKKETGILFRPEGVKTWEVHPIDQIESMVVRYNEVL